MMERHEWELTEQQIIMMGRVVQGVKLEEYIEQANRALAVGPVFQPSEWIAGHEELGRRVRLAEKLLDFQIAVERLRPGGEGGLERTEGEEPRMDANGHEGAGVEALTGEGRN